MIIDESKQDTKLPAIMRAAVRLFVRRGVASTTIKDIAKEAKVAEGTLYRHYSSKDELAHDLLEKNLRTFTAFMEEKAGSSRDWKVRLRAVVNAFAEAFEDNPDEARFILFSHASEMGRLPKDMRTPRHVVMEILDDAVDEGDLQAGKDPEVLQAMVLGGLSRVLLAKAHGEIKADLKSKTETMYQALLGLLGQK